MSKFCIASAIAFFGAATLHGCSCKEPCPENAEKACIEMYNDAEKGYNDVDKIVSATNTKDQITKNCQKVAQDEEKARTEFLNAYPKEVREQVDETQVKIERQKMQAAAAKCFAAGQKTSPNSLNAWHGFEKSMLPYTKYFDTKSNSEKYTFEFYINLNQWHQLH